MAQLSPLTTVATCAAVVIITAMAMAVGRCKVDEHRVRMAVPHMHMNHKLNPSNVAIVTAVTGSIDNIPGTDLANRIIYDETHRPLLYPRRDLNQRLRSKYFKMCTHWLHPKFSSYIWADGTFTIKAGIVEWLIAKLGDADCAFFKHPHRSTIKQESDFVLDKIKHGDAYLKIRYGNESMAEQVDAYVADGFPLNLTALLAGGLFIRRNSEKVNAAFDHWFVENVKWTIQDQLSLPYILWKHNLTVVRMDGSLLFAGPYHKHGPHAGLA